MPLEGATHAVQLSKAAASEMRRVIQRAADTEVGCKSSLSNIVVVVVIEHSRQQLENRK
jgi:hypothetical protein